MSLAEFVILATGAYVFLWSLFVLGMLYDIRQACRRSADSQEDQARVVLRKRRGVGI